MIVLLDERTHIPAYVWDWPLYCQPRTPKDQGTMWSTKPSKKPHGRHYQAMSQKPVYRAQRGQQSRRSHSSRMAG